MNSDPENDQNVDVEAAVPAAEVDIQTTTTTGDIVEDDADETVEIDPAEFFDPEEFGYRRPQGRVSHDLWA